MHQGVCLGRTFLRFLTKEVLAREWCRTEIRNALHAPTNRDPRIADGLCGGTRLADRTSARRLAAPPPHRCRDCASSGLARLVRRAYTVVSYLFASRKPSAVIFTTRIDASGPSFTPSSTYIAAITVLRCDWDGRPTVLIGLSVRAVRALRHRVVACCSSPRMNGTRAANLAYLAFVLPQSTYATFFYQDAMSCRVRASAVGNQATPLVGKPDWTFPEPSGRQTRAPSQSSPDFTVYLALGSIRHLGSSAYPQYTLEKQFGEGARSLGHPRRPSRHHHPVEADAQRRCAPHSRACASSSEGQRCPVTRLVRWQGTDISETAAACPRS
jgi:hypothetical protein